METQEAIASKEDFSIETEKAAQIAEQQGALVPYEPKSKASFKLGTLIPKNMAFEVQKALNRVVKEKGNIDNYVRNHLKYQTSEALWAALAAEQVDSIALYLKQFELGQGIIIADQTGIGKGRQAAAIIRHAIVNGYLPVFFTKKPELFSDMYRDLTNIGFGQVKPFIVNTDAKKAAVKDEEGIIVHRPLTIEEQKEVMTTTKVIPTESQEARDYFKNLNIPLPDTETVKIIEAKDRLPSEYNAIFTTYSQIPTPSIYKQLWLAKIANSGIEGSKKYPKTIFILDESHMAGGFDSKVGEWMRSVLPATKAACYLSATFAKKPEVMPLYGSKTAIQEASLSDNVFVSNMVRGGLALQEIVASNLAESGQLLRRQRSNEGVLVDYIYLTEEPKRTKSRERVDRFIELMGEIVSFEAEFITPYLDRLHDAARAAGEKLTRQPKEIGIKRPPYFSRIFNIIDQLLFALKVEEVAAKCIELLNEDKKVVIAFKSTMGAFLSDLQLVNGDKVPENQLDFARVLMKGLDSLFYYNYTDIDNKHSKIQVQVNTLPQVGVDRYNAIKTAIWSESSGLNISPIDQLIDLIQRAPKSKMLGGHEGKQFSVAEVTGRTQRIAFIDGEAIVESFDADAEKSFREFNKGDIDVLLINQSGSTGSSAHASADFADQRQRAMLIHQFELDINVEVQKRGRTNRTGQVVLPEYYYMISDIPLERRLMAMLKGKLKMLDANTTASQKTSDDTLESPDFFDKYGDKAAFSWVDENKHLMNKMGWPTYHKAYDEDGKFIGYERNMTREGAVNQVTGRAGLLAVKEQDRLYTELTQKYEAEVEQAIQDGSYDLETEFLKLDAKVQQRFVFDIGSGGKSPFGRDVLREKCLVNNLKRPYTKNEVDKLLQDHLGKLKPEQLQIKIVEDLEETYPKIVAQRVAELEATVKSLEEEFLKMPAEGSGANESENDTIDYERARLADMLKNKKKEVEDYIEEMEETKNLIIKNMNLFKVGQVVQISTHEKGVFVYGIFMGVIINKKLKNPYTLHSISLQFAVSSKLKRLQYNLTSYPRSVINTIYVDSKDIDAKEERKVQLTWNDLVRANSAKREPRQILTENVLKASVVSGKLIKYNTMDGVIKNGVLMPYGFGKDEKDDFTLFPISKAKATIEGLEIDKGFTDSRSVLTFKKISTNLLELLIEKKGNQPLYNSPIIRALLQHAEGENPDELPEFVQNGGNMVAVLHLKNIDAFLKELDKLGFKYLSEAEEYKELEEENQADWAERTDKDGKRHSYQLSKPYGDQSNPQSGFIEYSEPSEDFPNGTVTYLRALTDIEKANYSMKPVFEKVEEPYQDWKKFILDSDMKDSFFFNVEEAQKQGITKGIKTLGNFIFRNAHEEINPELVFGNYGLYDLGFAAYEDMIGEITALELLIQQLNLALNEA